MEPQSPTVPDHNEGHISHTSKHSKYGIFDSLQAMLGAVSKNPLKFTLALVVSCLLSAVVLSLTFTLMAKLVIGQFGLLFASSGRVITVVIIGLLVYTLLYALTYAYTLSSIAISLTDKGSTGTVLKKALYAIPRVLKTNVLVAIVSFWPLVAVIFFPLLSPRGYGNDSQSILTLIFLIAALIWVLIAQLRYALAPFVALFEPKVSVTKTLQRSQELLKTKGQWFIVKGVLLLIGLMIILGALTHSTFQELRSTDDLYINLIFIFLSVLVEGSLVMLYLHSAHKHTSASRKAPGLLTVAIMVLAVLFGLAATQSKTDSFGGNLSAGDQEKLNKIAYDIERKTDILGLNLKLELYYNQHGFYPPQSDIGNTEWLTGLGNDSSFSNDRMLSDPKGIYINGPGSDYRYVAKPDNCTKCASYELAAQMDEGGEYKKTSLNTTSLSD